MVGYSGNTDLKSLKRRGSHHETTKQIHLPTLTGSFRLLPTISQGFHTTPRLFKKVPYSVLPSASRASLALFGTASRDVISRRASLFVIPRHASAEGPLASLGATEKGSGRQKRGLGVTAGGLVQKHFYYSLVDLTDKHQEGAKIRESFKGSIL